MIFSFEGIAIIKSFITRFVMVTAPSFLFSRNLSVAAQSQMMLHCEAPFVWQPRN